jgi:hypothetical protein
MNTGRRAFNRRSGAASRSKAGEFPKWNRLSHVYGPFLRDSGSSERRRIFAIVAPPKVDLGGKTIRRILIFDNHPESLRLLSQQHVTSVVDSAASRRASMICGSILIAMVIGALLWPLFW